MIIRIDTEQETITVDGSRPMSLVMAEMGTRPGVYIVKPNEDPSVGMMITRVGDLP